MGREIFLLYFSPPIVENFTKYTVIHPLHTVFGVNCFIWFRPEQWTFQAFLVSSSVSGIHGILFPDIRHLFSLSCHASIYVLFMYFACLSVFLSVCPLYLKNVKTAEPFRLNFFVGPRVTPGKVYRWSNFQKLASHQNSIFKKFPLRRYK